MIHRETSLNYPKGQQIPPGTSVVQCDLGNGTVAVKVSELVVGEQGYVVHTPEGVSMGELLTLDEVKARVLENFN